MSENVPPAGQANETAAGASSPIPEGDEIAPYRLQNPLEIGAVLRQLVSRGDFVTVYFNEGQRFLLSRILEVDIKARTFCFDWGGHEATNQALLNAGRKLFVAAPDGVKVQFSLSDVSKQEVEGRPAFVAPFPADLIKLQRREFFRLATPVGKPYKATFTLPDGKRHAINLHDLSLGGVGLSATAQEGEVIELGLVLPQAQMDLGAGGVLVADLEVRSKRPYRTNTGEHFHVGCRFVNLSRAAEANLQRLMAQLERERKALTG
ncbi:c-di-GMP-binding flagellar brake protein YcgR, contains PilZNR and PilZ domains [Andreprevotia lacus DSM 23236]|jgi:c-di-GMP-binding flagellar brake protein YcgR|uniref:Flagellar brake protein YcgR n=1 Tax=Andreprevotia lacus DSM 23236 TaxID=1121001 RepID=A0A1W1XKK5_9NEIS|nr:flagellar brake protein [Andreprevotia lacus]SMC24334.1 c-di-GMP-binding flagellar brake protein YcgR, contains PilZNR and PilZ domains [Andreprevotia lacus DSM 23236]